MDLELRSTNGVRGPIQTLSDHVTFYLVKRSNKITFAAESRLREDEIKLGRIGTPHSMSFHICYIVLSSAVYGRSGAKLQAIQPLHVLPGHDLSSSMAIDPRSEAYQLGPASVDQTEIMLLRHGDIITSPSAKDSVACVTPASAVQVNSSATEQVHDETHVNADGDEGIPEDETEDEATPKDTVTEVPVTQTITQPSKSQPSATPNLPKDKSVVIHETPTTDRVVGLHEYEVANANEDHQMAPLLQETVPVTETFSTARTGNSPMHVAKRSSDTECVTERKWPHGSPQVRVNERREKKRRSTSPSSGLEAELSTEGRLVKRARKTTSLDNDRSETHHASPLDGINADLTRTTYSTKRNKRSKVTPDATPTKSFRSSQRSGTATTAAAYEGDLPRVAFSNSAINEKSPSAKFLRKNGGTWLSAVDDKCNVLWYGQSCCLPGRPCLNRVFADKEQRSRWRPIKNHEGFPSNRSRHTYRH